MTTASDILFAINGHMNGGKCPTSASLGECAAISTMIGASGHTYYAASLYLWRAATDLKAADVARWFTDAGALSPIVSAVLHDADNATFAGFTDDGARHWEVSFWLYQDTTQAAEKPEDAAFPAEVAP